ncbi:hypothetical protein K2173_011267 [Erythroxylum novogranatense]|uniref:PGG domain-containing protein n=1 Tax=Erythroxylum novogranatense TaxID=1862640 RepID=A0AAV8S9J6_9ROSI|nr:hypothetical protein K2173_011267 [Erythroxylum novogranatense]
MIQNMKVVGPPPVAGKNWLRHFQYEEERDSPNEARTVLLVVAALIAAVTFQAGVNPPGGIWQETSEGHVAGRAIYATHKEAFYVFLFSNTLAFSSSISVIGYITHGFPFRFETLVAIFCMAVTYGSSVLAVMPREAHSYRFRYVVLAGLVPPALRCLILLYRKVKSRSSK